MDLLSDPPPPIERVVELPRPDLPEGAILAEPARVNPLYYRAKKLAEEMKAKKLKKDQLQTGPT
ncbi:MAG TPA: hypothetical protein PLX89_08875 [Verrucomicrobiota bacterium]|nr:hypothetical protein [Verrucomicrobiales bacterium]HRI13106.1 hypothetical protein [Verrucomicrobiota bacterium]